jgi:hypothetical protein
MKGGVYVSIDLGSFGGDLGALIAQKVAAKIFRKARELVRVSTPLTAPYKEQHGELRNSIKNIGINRSHFIVVAETPYAAAQEWGRPDLPRYGYTPYMTPAAEEAASNESLSQICDEAMGNLKDKMAWRKLHGI